MAQQHAISYDQPFQGAMPTGFTSCLTLSDPRGGRIRKIVWSPDGGILAAVFFDKLVCLWDAQTGNTIHRLAEQGEPAYCLAWSPTLPLLALGSREGNIQLWNTQIWELSQTLTGHSNAVVCLAWSPDGRRLASGSYDMTLQLWEIEAGRSLRMFTGHTNVVTSMAWSPDGDLLASGSADTTIRLWDTVSGRQIRAFKKPDMLSVHTVAWSPDGRVLASGSSEGFIRLWDVVKRRQTHTLEGHSRTLNAIAFSHDGWLLASKAQDNTVRLWRCDTWEMVATLEEQASGRWFPDLAFHPRDFVLATVGERDQAVHLWKLDTTALLSGATHWVRRITAKIVLVGESGFGKTGLGWRLAHGEFKEQASTHGQQFWTLEQLHTRLDDGTECEAMLWDFAGQPDYRLIHTLFLDDVDLALVLFNPTDWQEPLRGVDYWLKALSQRQEHPCRIILVGARTDRGEFTLTEAEIEAFCRDRNITGGYVATSALTGEGLAELIDRMKQQIDWNNLSVTTTTDSYEHIKKQLLLLKEGATSTQILIDFTRLQQQLQAAYPWQFSEAEVVEAVCQLEKHGYVRMLRTVLGERRILLAPELLNNLAASCVLEARRHPQGLGALDENRLLSGDYGFPELIGLDAQERNGLLAEVAALLLDKNICFRQSDEAGTALIFPELINRRQTSTKPLSFEDDVSYTLSGPTDSVYAALTVLLGYTCILIHNDQWQHQIQYESKPGEVFGVRQLQEREGDIDLVLYFNDLVNLSDRRLFRGLFERFATGLNVAITRYPPLVCVQCGYPQERAEIVRRTAEGYDFVFCSNCGRKNILLKAGKEILSQEQTHLLDRQQAIARQKTIFEVVLACLKAFIISRPVKLSSPSCLIMYTCDRNERWVTRSFAQDLKNAGIKIILNTLLEDTEDTAAFQKSIDFIESNDSIIIVGTNALPEDYQQTLARSGSRSTKKLSLVNLRLLAEEKKKTVIPVLREGDAANSLPSLLQSSEYVDLRHEETYFANLFDLILNLYGISFSTPGIVDLRELLRTDCVVEQIVDLLNFS